MFKMLIGRSERGGGLMMAGMAAAAIAGAGMMMGELFVNAEDVIKKDNRVNSYVHLVDTFRKNIYAGNNCTAVFANGSAQRQAAGVGNINFASAMSVSLEDLPGMPQASRPMIKDLGVDISVPVRFDESVTVMGSGWKAKTGTSIKAIHLIGERRVKLPAPMTSTERTVRYPANVSNPSGPLVDLKAADAYIVIEPDHKGINVWSPENKKFWIKIYVYYAPDGSIHSCYDPNSEAAFCTETLKGTFVNDPTLSSDKRCRPDLGCFTYKSGLIAKNEQCPAGYNSTDVGGNLKTCSWCPSSPYPLPLPSTFSQTGADGAQDLVDLEDLDCSASDPYAGTGLSAAEIWQNYQYYQGLRSSLTPEQQAQYAGCLNFIPPCADDPNTCLHECNSGLMTEIMSGCDNICTTNVNECGGGNGNNGNGNNGNGNGNNGNGNNGNGNGNNCGNGHSFENICEIQ